MEKTDIDEKVLNHIYQTIALYGYDCKDIKVYKYNGTINIRIEDIKK